MELNFYNVLFAFWIATVFMSMWKLYFPSVKILELARPNSLVVKYQLMSFTIFLFMSWIFAPFLIPAILSDKYRFTFIKSYLETVDKNE